MDRKWEWTAQRKSADECLALGTEHLMVCLVQTI